MILCIFFYNLGLFLFYFSNVLDIVPYQCVEINFIYFFSFSFLTLLGELQIHKKLQQTVLRAVGCPLRPASPGGHILHNCHRNRNQETDTCAICRLRTPLPSSRELVLCIRRESVQFYRRYSFAIKSADFIFKPFYSCSNTFLLCKFLKEGFSSIFLK